MKLAICCSSSDNVDKNCIESSQKLLEALFKQKNDLVFGAMNHGLMGIAYRTAKKYNRSVTGIAPELYKDDFKELDCDTEILTKTVSERMKALIDNSDALIILPGGIGTLYELMAAIEMKRSKEFDKPIIIYNQTRFFDEFLYMINKIYRRGYSDQGIRSNYNLANDYMSVIDILNRKQLKETEDLCR